MTWRTPSWFQDHDPRGFPESPSLVELGQWVDPDVAHGQVIPGTSGTVMSVFPSGSEDPQPPISAELGSVQRAENVVSTDNISMKQWSAAEEEPS